MRSTYWQSIALLLICLAGNATAQEVHKRRSGVFATESISAAMPISQKARIVIASTAFLSGSISITTATTDSLKVTYVKIAKAANRSMAIDFIDLISVLVEGRPEAPIIKLRSPNPAPWSGTNYSGRVEAEIEVPPGVEIEINATKFDVTVQGPLRALDIPESLGRLEISGITERLTAITSNRRVFVSDVTGKIVIATSNSSLTAKSLTSLDGQARLRNEGGNIRITDFVGSINIRNSFGRITLEQFLPRGEGSYIRSASGPVTIDILEMTEGQLVVTNRQEDIDITVPDTLSAFYSLSVGDGGVIEATNFPFTPDMVQPNRLSLQSGDGLVEITGSIKGKGNIYIRGR